jgi:hypothetical protein
MQCLFQKSDGTRVRVSQDAYNQMLWRYGTKRISHIVRNKSLVIFCLRGNEYVKPDNPRYGGGRLRNPYQELIR